jgi:hypothetical protein
MPPNWKWWCSGAQRNTRLPRSLNEATWIDHRQRFGDEHAADDEQHQFGAADHAV